MAQVEVMLHPQVHTSKPTNYGGYKYFNSLTTKNVTLTELAEHVSKGKIFFPSVHLQTETISASTFSHQQLCLVDIDNSVENPYLFSEESIVALAESFGLDVALIYRTQSYTTEVPKFRVGFIVDRVFTKYEGVLEEAHNALYRIINSVSSDRLVDTSCNEPSRLFNGALYDSEPYVNEDAAPFNAEALIKLTKDLAEVPEKKEKPIKNGYKIQKDESSNTTDSIEAIKAGNVQAFRTVFVDNLQRASAHNESNISNFAYKAVTGNVEEAISEANMKDAYELFNHLPMAELFSLPNANSFECVVHDDSRPSASIFSDDIDMYKCFSSRCSCGEKAHTNFMLLAHFIGGKKKAIKFINALFGIEVTNALTERVARNKAFIESEAFKEACPVTYKLISAFNFKRKLFETLESVASVVTPVQLTKDENDCSFFYSMSEMEKLMEGTIACTSPDAISQMMAFAALLGLVNKRSDEELIDDTFSKLQEQRIRTAERTNQEASDVRRLSVYNVPLLSEMDLAELEAVAIKAKNGGISASKMNRNLVAQAFGEQTAKLVYPTEKSTVVSYKKRADVIRVKKAIQTCLQKHNVADKTTVKEILGSLVEEMSRREFDNAYSIALAELGLQTEVVTNLHRELFAKDFPRNTRISFYPETIEVILNGEEEIKEEEIPVAVGAETSAFMQTIIASLNEEEYQEEVTSISHVAVEVEEIPIVSATESNRSSKTESNRKAAIKFNAIKPMSVDNKIVVEVFNEHDQLVGYQTLSLSQNRPTREKSSATRRNQASYIYDYIRIKRCKKRAPAGRRMPYSRCKPNNNWKVYTLDDSIIACT
ncbi:hypothetical protein U1P98_07595 [Lysinibacillus irui]|uniref:Uncharacterized protein n=1 Tax=Lysinibacillus irui TaxID=2998077 RepID=A0ABU5NJH5_9BACI|nr:hypothetical protein [Lysinibacillus irui]MEA0553779.1 hypothetical protein [Lysinibacillus irui]MEA0976163.1 hypothetical protein [Lysinibacillus irui]MEA1042317.1 hypothetical protein [Lysinibacillus irui]